MRLISQNSENLGYCRIVSAYDATIFQGVWPGDEATHSPVMQNGVEGSTKPQDSADHLGILLTPGGEG